MLVIGCSGAKSLAKRAAKRLKADYSELVAKKFPDNELYVCLEKNVKDKDVVFFQSYFGDVNTKIIETLLAANTAKSLGARKIILMAPYFSYLRQDKRFKKGDAISARIIAEMHSIFDFVFIIDPHLHRFAGFEEFFKNAVRISSVKQIADYIKKHIPNPVIVGPDKESFQWADRVAMFLGKRAEILKKKRFSARHVKVSTSVLHELNGRNVIIVDDIISTGKTMLEVINRARQLKAKRIYCIAVHGVFAPGSLKKLKNRSKVITCNTIPSGTSQIDVLPEIVSVLKKIGDYEKKINASKTALKYIKPGMVIGLGSGSTVSEFVKLLGRVNEKKEMNIKAVPSSKKIENLARLCNISLTKRSSVDIAVDGADEIDSDFNLLKGKGAFAFVNEKKIDYKAKKCIIIADGSKLRRKLGKEILVEVKNKSAIGKLKKLGFVVQKEFISGSNFVVFLKTRHDFNPKKLEKRIDKTAGVVGSGIFANFRRRPVIIIGKRNGSEVLK